MSTRSCWRRLERHDLRRPHQEPQSTRGLRRLRLVGDQIGGGTTEDPYGREWLLLDPGKDNFADD